MSFTKLNTLKLLMQLLFVSIPYTNCWADFSVTSPPENIDVWIDSKTPIFQDNFDGKELNPKYWGQRLPGPRGDCINTSEAVTIKGGHLGLHVFSKTIQGQHKHYCAMISTEGLFQSTYGYWEANLRFNYQQGIQTAFWLQSPTNGQDLTDPAKSGAELDVFEHVAGQSPTGNNYAAHWNGYKEHARHWSKSGQLAVLGDGNFHRFGIYWSPEGYAFYVDGKRTEIIPKEVPISKASQYIILSTELPHATAEMDFGPLGSKAAILEVEKVRVYSLK